MYNTVKNDILLYTDFIWL